MSTTTPPSATPPSAEHLDRVRPRLLALAADLAAGGDRTKRVPPDLTAAALDRIAEVATTLAAELRHEGPSG